MKTIVALCFLAAPLGAHATRTAPEWKELAQRHNEGNPFAFAEYTQVFGKEYTAPGEHAHRKNLFEQRLEQIIAHNKDESSSYRKGINHMTDWTDSEFDALMGYNPRADAGLLKEAVNVESPPAVKSLPLAVDWRSCNRYSDSPLCPRNDVKTSVATPVKNQGRCGSCYAFGSTAVLESHLAIQTGVFMDLSPQHIVSCAPNTNNCGGTGGCGGSTADVVYNWINQSGGLVGEFDYGYSSGQGNTGNCESSRINKPWAKVGSALGKPQSNNYTALMEALMIGPVAVNVYASTWRDYESGIYDGCDFDDIPLNHVVSLEGYGPDYWLIRNSWGPLYGEEGYIKLRKEPTPQCGTDSKPGDGWNCDGHPATVEVCGMCGVAFEPTYPTGVTRGQ